MALKKQTHTNFQEVSAELKNIEDTKQAKITFANRAPLASDKDTNIWINYAGASGSRWYFRHPLTGTWTTQ